MLTDSDLRGSVVYKGESHRPKLPKKAIIVHVGVLKKNRRCQGVKERDRKYRLNGIFLREKSGRWQLFIVTEKTKNCNPTLSQGRKRKKELGSPLLGSIRFKNWKSDESNCHDCWFLSVSTMLMYLSHHLSFVSSDVSSLRKKWKGRFLLFLYLALFYSTILITNVLHIILTDSHNNPLRWVGVYIKM